ncbi:MAG: SusD/RagB family nutrient-binding outer membrane lipoprotein [Chitinophagaceae bacterium]|nr:SusD/RagB family nutrient-binding outer membrane lipoprotein [Chitinophagaceae bacterium]
MKKIFLSIFAVTALIGCKKKFEEINISPNSPTNATTDLLINGAQVTSIIFYEGELARTANMWSGAFSGEDRQYAGLSKYVTSASDYDGGWSNAYRGVFAQCLLIEQEALKVNNRIQAGIAKVMRAQVAGTVASLWGDIPFTEAGQAEKFPKPKYDAQAAVYASVQTLLTEAIADLNSNVGVSPAAKDVFYQGSRTAWIRAAYSLKARFFLHTKQYQLAYDNALLGISSPSGDMYAPHGVSYNQDFNIYYSFTVYDRGGYMAANSFAAPLLDETTSRYRGNVKTDENGRYNFLFIKDFAVYNSGYELNFLSDDLGFAPDGPGMFGAEQRFPLITYAETQLIAAESAIRLSSPNFGNALTALNNHRAALGQYIPASYRLYGFKYDPYVAADFNAGGIENPGTLTANAALLREIIEERYVTLIGQIEIFNDIRRTKNSIGVSPAAGTQIPQRFFYSQQEINTNPNTPKLVAADLYRPTPVNN